MPAGFTSRRQLGAVEGSSPDRGVAPGAAVVPAIAPSSELPPPDRLSLAKSACSSVAGNLQCK